MAGPQVHPTAVVANDVILEEDVVVGPYCIIEAGAHIGAGTRLLNHVSIQGNILIGQNNTIYPYAVLGAPPQDLSYRHTPTWVQIGDNNIIREHVTIHRATEKEDGYTRVGSNNYFMASSHIAHDCQVGSNIMMANLTTLAGHVHVHDFAVLSGLIGVHHFTTIGSYAFVGGCSRITTDVPPYMLVEGNPSEIRCVNLVGLRRRGFANDEIRSLSEAHRLLYRMHRKPAEVKDWLLQNAMWNESVAHLLDFLNQHRQGFGGRGRENRKAA